MSTRSTASSADRALSRSRRSLNCVESTLRSSSRPLRLTSSAAIAVGSVMPWRISVVASRTPNSPNRSINRARISASGAPGSVELGAGEAVDRQQHRLDVRPRHRGERGERGELVLAHRAAGLGEEPRHRHHGLAQPADLVVGAVAPGDLPRGRERVQPARADLVGPRQHADRVDRGGPRHALVEERLEEAARRRRAGGASGR